MIEGETKASYRSSLSELKNIKELVCCETFIPLLIYMKAKRIFMRENVTYNKYTSYDRAIVVLMQETLDNNNKVTVEKGLSTFFLVDNHHWPTSHQKSSRHCHNNLTSRLLKSLP